MWLLCGLLLGTTRGWWRWRGRRHRHRVKWRHGWWGAGLVVSVAGRPGPAPRRGRWWRQRRPVWAGSWVAWHCVHAAIAALAGVCPWRVWGPSILVHSPVWRCIVATRKPVSIVVVVLGWQWWSPAKVSVAITHSVVAIWLVEAVAAQSACVRSARGVAIAVRRWRPICITVVVVCYRVLPARTTWTVLIGPSIMLGVCCRWVWTRGWRRNTIRTTELGMWCSISWQGKVMQLLIYLVY